MGSRLIAAIAVVMAFAAATAYAAVTPIPTGTWPPACHPRGKALRGDAEPNTIRGTAKSDLLVGGGGHDVLYGEGNHPGRRDCLFGQRGPDSLYGGPGTDLLMGGPWRDRLRGGKAGDFIHDTDGRNRISCGKGIDRVVTNARSKVAANCEHVTRR
ncbi:MAG: calcium-binding protein [Solirubrobacterales bacterium]